MSLTAIWATLKLYATEIGAVVTAAITVYGWWKLVWSRKKERDRVNTLVAVGDRLATSADLEGDGHEQAIVQYRKALELDGGNVEVHRRITRTTRRKLELEPEVRLLNTDVRKEIDAALTRMYEFQASHPALKDDLELLLDEAALLQLAGKRDSALAVLKNAQAGNPEDPAALAQLGLATRDAALVRRAIGKQPQEARYHEFLGYVLEKQGQQGEAIRAYRRAAELATGADLASRRLRVEALNGIFRVFRHGDVLRPELDLPLDERLQAMEFFVAGHTTRDAGQHFLLAALYHARGEHEKAHTAIRTALGEEKKWWGSGDRKQMLPLFARILEDGRLDAATLAEVRTMLGAV